MNYKIGFSRKTAKGVNGIMVVGDQEKAIITIINDNNIDTFEIAVEPGFWLLNQEDAPEIIEQLYAESLGLLN